MRPQRECDTLARSRRSKREQSREGAIKKKRESNQEDSSRQLCCSVLCQFEVQSNVKVLFHLISTREMRDTSIKTFLDFTESLEFISKVR